jgi:tetratricopeptide (TPR) repeat protein
MPDTEGFNMRMLPSVIAIIAFFLLLAAPVQGALPEAEIYADDDRYAMAFHARPGRKAELRKYFDKRIKNNSRDVIALSHRAYLFIRSEDFDLARRDFERALDVSKHDPRHRQVLWAYAWGLYDMKDVEGALARWRETEKLHGGRPFWVPYTYALAYWTLRDRETALTWFSTNVRSEPEWGTREGFEDRIRHWRPEQKAEMRALFDAWSKQRGPAQ